MHSDGADGYGNGAGRLSMTRNLSMTGNNVSEWLYMLEDYARSIHDIAILKDTVSPSAIPHFTPNLPFIADKDEDFLPGSLAIRSFIAQRVTWKKLHMYELDKHDKEKASGLNGTGRTPSCVKTSLPLSASMSLTRIPRARRLTSLHPRSSPSS
jgi:hypothetical protein